MSLVRLTRRAPPTNADLHLNLSKHLKNTHVAGLKTHTFESYAKIDMFQEKDGWTPMYVKKLLFKVAMILLIIGGLNWLCVGAFDTDIVRTLFGKGLFSDCIFIHSFFIVRH